MVEPSRLMHCCLYCRSANTCERGDFVDRQIANAMTLDLASHDAKDCPLAFGVVVPEIVGQCARPAEHPASIPRRLAIR
jgi:hypothetical protein